MKLAELANNSLRTISPTDSIDQAMRTMSDNHIHHLPVVEDSKLVGILSDRDLLAACGHGPDESHPSLAVAQDGTPLCVGDVMTSEVKTLTQSDTVVVAGKLMMEEKIHCVPLLLGERVVGIVTETDLLKLYVDHPTRYLGHKVLDPEAAWRRQPVSIFMRRRHIATAKPGETPVAVFTRMQEKRVRHLLVLHNDKVVGLVSDSDVRRAVQLAKPRTDDAPHATNVAGIMTRKLETIAVSSTLEETADHMLRDSIGALPVMEETRLVGLITETDLLRALIAAWP